MSVTVILDDVNCLYDKTIESLNKIGNFIQTAKELLSSPLSDYPICVTLKLPSHLEPAIEQYLIYISGFLKDSGHQADVSIVKHDGQVFLGVKPYDPDVSLESFTEIISIYFKLPNIVEENHSPSYEQDLSIQKYLAAIDHLKSQLRLSQTALSYQDGMIASQNTLIRNLESLVENSITQVRVKDDQVTSIFGGALKVGTWKKGPVEVNSPMIINNLKKLIGKGE